ITTRLPASAFEDAVAEGGPAAGLDVRVVPVPGLNRREALDYVTSRLTDYPDQRIEALDLGEDLAGLPLALAQATAAISARGAGLPAGRRSGAGGAGRRGRAAGDLAGRRRRGSADRGPAGAGPARAGPARLRRGAADVRRRPAVEAGGAPAAVPRRAVAGAQQAVRGGHHVLEV